MTIEPPPLDANRPVTIYDVAKAAGVATSTVSRAFARPGRVNADTAERIREVALRLGYHVSPPARASSASRTAMIAVITADITNPFYYGIIRGAEAAAMEAGYTMMLADAHESDELEHEVLARALPIVEGIVMASSRISDTAVRMAAKQKPLMQLNRIIAGVPCLLADNSAGIRMAAEHLAELGHRSITYVAGPEHSWADGIRWHAVVAAAADLGLRSRRIGPFKPTVAGGEKAAAGVLARRTTTAVITYNDLIAIGLIKRLTAEGVRVPEQVSVVGFDNIFAADLITPPLTTLGAQFGAMGHTAVRNVVAMIHGAKSRAAEPLILPVELMLRGSTGPPPDRSRSNPRQAG
jgi:LacI family transcriptional regulator